jgi:nitrate/nitrite transport system ATP-binding protein
VPDHDPRKVPLVRIGRTEPTIVGAPKVVDTTSPQTIAR